MNVSLRVPRMTRDQFLDWVERQEAPYEFDGFEPVPITGGNNRHSRLCRDLLAALSMRLNHADYEVLPEVGVATIGRAVRYPDVLIATANSGADLDRLVPEPVVVFEVISPSSGRIDRTVKLREYASVASIRCYVLIDSAGPDIDVFSRMTQAEPWTQTALTTGETLVISEISLELPVSEIFRGVKFD